MNEPFPHTADESWFPESEVEAELPLPDELNTDGSLTDWLRGEGGELVDGSELERYSDPVEEDHYQGILPDSYRPREGWHCGFSLRARCEYLRVSLRYRTPRYVFSRRKISSGSKPSAK